MGPQGPLQGETFLGGPTDPDPEAVRRLLNSVTLGGRRYQTNKSYNARDGRAQDPRDHLQFLLRHSCLIFLKGFEPLGEGWVRVVISRVSATSATK